jgi:GH25 family lysozyme M1 (1,4-beta-N-acetylmuramidase)
MQKLLWGLSSMSSQRVFTVKDGKIDFTVQYGSKGQLVKDFQRYFNASAFVEQFKEIGVDGIFGPQTKKAVQLANGSDDDVMTIDTMNQINMNAKFIIDVSDHQARIDFKGLAALGIFGVYYKLTEGFDWKAKRAERLHEAIEAGMKVGVYHYGRPDLHPRVDEARIERRNFEEEKKKLGLTFDLNDVYDLEEGNRDDEEHNTRYFTAFAQGDCVDLYTAKYAIDAFCTSDIFHAVLENNHNGNLWWAEYVRAEKKGGPDKIPAMMDPCSMWQFTAKFLSGCVRRYNGEAGYIDLNIVWGEYSHKNNRRCKVDSESN